MKKLFLLLVVVIGFTATTFAQVSANAGANGVINQPAAAAPLSINWVQDMDFGTIINNSTNVGQPTFANPLTAYLEIFPIAGGAPTISPLNLTFSGVPRVAKFLVRNVNNGGVLKAGDITLTHNIDHTLSGGDAWFETSSAVTASGLRPGVNYTVFDQVSGSNDYFVSVGGILLMNQNAKGGFNVSGLTVTINNH